MKRSNHQILCSLDFYLSITRPITVNPDFSAYISKMYTHTRPNNFPNSEKNKTNQRRSSLTSNVYVISNSFHVIYHPKLVWNLTCLNIAIWIIYIVTLIYMCVCVYYKICIESNNLYSRIKRINKLNLTHIQSTHFWGLVYKWIHWMKPFSVLIYIIGSRRVFFAYTSKYTHYTRTQGRARANNWHSLGIDCQPVLWMTRILNWNLICLKWLKEDLKFSQALLKCKLTAYDNMMSYWSDMLNMIHRHGMLVAQNPHNIEYIIIYM